MNGVRWRRVIAAIVVAAISGCSPSGAGAPPPQAPAPPAASAPAPETQRSAPQAASHDLSEDEALGGHTLQRHVGKSDADLIRRLDREQQISSASTYTDRATAESVVGAALRADNQAFAAWRRRSGPRPNFVLRYQANRVIGRSVARGQRQAVPCDRAVIVIRWDEQRRRSYVLTSYPEKGR